MSNAQIVVCAKCEHTPPELMQRVAGQIRELNPDAEILREHYSAKENAWWRALVDLPAEDQAVIGESGESQALSQIGLSCARLANPAELIQILEDCLRGEFGHIARAKGTVLVGDEILRFDLADRLYAVTGSDVEKRQCVFIGEELNKLKLCQRMGTTLFKEGYGPVNAGSRSKRPLRKSASSPHPKT